MRLLKIINSIIAWVYILVTITLGLLLIVAVSGWYGVRESIDMYMCEQLNSPTGIWTGFALVFCGVLFFSLKMREGLAQKSISFDNPEGAVTITVKAIEEFVKRVSLEFSQVLEMKPSVLATREGLKIRAKLVLIAGSHVPRLVEGIQHTIKSRMQNILGIENITGVEIHISKLVTKAGGHEETSQQTMDMG